MKFSVLIPTRNRLALLRYAIESVCRQDYPDWELVVSDNDSTEDVESYVRGLGDARIHYVRTASFIPVTDNWNHALARSTGDYVVMLGDDDSLLPGYFRTLAALIDKYSQPDLIYVEAVQFAYPGVIPGHPTGFVQTGYCEFMAGRTEPFLLSKAAARSAVDQSMALRLSFSFNMQHSLVSRRAIDRLAVRGPFYQSPYPDYYASNVMLLTADAMLVVPEPLVAIGISPKSFGYFYFNGREDEGTAFLNNLGASSIPESARKWIVPGSVLLTCWFLAMAAIEQNFGREFGVRADHDRYRYLQVLHLDRRAGWNVLRELYSALSAGEILRYGSRRALLLIAARLLPARAAARYVEETTIREGPFPRFDPKKRPVDYRDILELFEDWPRFRRDLSATAN